MRKSNLRKYLVGGAAAGAIALALGAPAWAQEATYDFNQPSMEMAAAIQAVGHQTGANILVDSRLVSGLRSPELKGALSTDQALLALLDGTGLTMQRTDKNSILIRRASDPQSGSAAGDGADQGTVAALVVTAQKREENIQDVPIAMSAFTQEDLTRSQVATGADLMTQVPNMTFTKTNFTSYSIQLRGIGTQAISATVDPAVAVAFNSTPMLRAHFFEQEFFDLERIEVLRGPQGTLYGRNATAGVVNLISAKPKFHFGAKASLDVGNYSSSRLEGMLNLPLVEDKAALRLAGAWTKRDGYTTNQLTGQPIDGRDLWATRLSLRVNPSERLDTNFIWEHFEEHDDRLRSGKQTCNRALTPATIDSVPTNVTGTGVLDPRRYLNQGCVAASVYSPDAFQTPDGITLPYFLPISELGGDIVGGTWDVYASTTQSRDLRVIESSIEPKYRVSSDTVELNFDYDLTDNLRLTSQTGFQRDFLFSTQDYNRFNTKSGAFRYYDLSETTNNINQQLSPSPVGLVYGPFGTGEFGAPCDPNVGQGCYTPGIFCDPQVGCSDRLTVMDLATERSRQFSQEFRIASDFEGPFNFSLGANYMRYKTLEDYYVFINSITEMLASYQSNGNISIWNPGVSDNHECMPRGFDYPNPEIPISPYQSSCAYIDPNPVTDLNGQGHNYFRNQNPYKLQSYAVFGEAYYDITSELKLTAGLRWTVDKKHFISIPSEILVAGYGYTPVGTIDQEWREPTGRLVLNWKPHLSFTDESMFYASYSHGYKAGGENPPGAALLVLRGGDIPLPTHPATFKPEFIDAYEVGSKNTLLDGRMTANLAAFYYDYTGYQISEIVDRSAINLNFDAKVWGVELESDWRPLENLRLGLKVGYENTRVGDGQSAVDLMDRANGGKADANGVTWMVVKPFPSQASNCVLPTYVVAAFLSDPDHFVLGDNGCTEAYLGENGVLLDPLTRLQYQANPTATFQGVAPPAGYIGFNPYTAPNRGAGFSKDLSGHSLPNAPHWTGTLTADYTLPLPNSWLMTLHSDFYYQSEAWARIFNMPGYDKLKAYTNVNLAAIFSNEDAGWTVMAYVKNVFDKDNITGTFLNSDDTGLTTNVFMNEPRLYGLRVTKNWTGAPWWGDGGIATSLPLRVEFEGFHAKTQNDHEVLVPGYASLFPSDLPFSLAPQNDLAAANGGGVKLTYQAAPDAWNFGLSVRYGRAGGGTEVFHRKDLGETCVLNYTRCHYASEGGPSAQSAPRKYGRHVYNESLTKSQEVHTFADFTVGKDVGLGAIFSHEAQSSFSVGLGYGRLKSMSEATLHGNPDFYLPPSYAVSGPDGLVRHPAYAHVFNDHIRADREFQGAGPELNWDASIPLLGNDASGHIDVDVGLGGVVLFGKQKAKVRGLLQGTYTQGGPVNPEKYVTPTYTTTIKQVRTKSATVPGVRANLGLSYSVGGVKVSGGYRMERYYKAIDGGLYERQMYDRTLEGPYFKIAVGFGG